jgi:polyphenol oxidase
VSEPVALPAPFRWEGEHIAASLPGGEVRFTTRRGGVSQPPYDAFNLGDHVEDDPAAVKANRAQLARDVLGVPWSSVQWGRQVHGTNVSTSRAVPLNADGQATADPKRPVLVMGADCVTVALATPGAVAAVHAGWKGLADGILERGVRTLRGELGARGEVQAAIGPCARGCCYEVGEEVHARFPGGVFRRGARNLALEAIAAHQLAHAGVGTVHDTGLCTMCAPEGLFFSHRRDGGTTGRQAAVAWRA